MPFTSARTSLVALLASLALSAPALASAPQPAKPVPPALFSGRWYEIARTPNVLQKDCQASTNEFSGWRGGAFAMVQTCHKGSPAGPKQVWNAKGRVEPSSGNAKMKVSFFGGMISQEYWIVDRAEDGAWAIMATPSGKYVWLLARQPVLDAASRARALQSIHAFGYDLSRLAFPQQLGR